MSTRKRLIQARRARNWSPRQVAERLQVHVGTYLDWETGRSFPLPGNLQALCALFACSAHELDLTSARREPQSSLPPCPAYQQTDRRLRAARRARGWDQQQVADGLGIAKDTYSLWERGLRTPSLPHLWLLCALFDRAPEELGYPIYTPAHAMGKKKP